MLLQAEERVSDPIEGRYQRIPGPAMGRDVHLWTFGWWGAPVLVFPTAGGMAHEWKHNGVVEALAPLLRAGRLKLYCPESNISQTWMNESSTIEERIERHSRYERFILETMVPYIRRDCNLPDARILTAGCSMGAMYASTFALKHPETFYQALCMSGRYRLSTFTDGAPHLDLYYNDPLAFVPNLHGAELERVRRLTRVTLVVGLGPWEGGCLPETLEFAEALAERDIPVHRDVWGPDAAHSWAWWGAQAAFHLSRLLP